MDHPRKLSHLWLDLLEKREEMTEQKPLASWKWIRRHLKGEGVLSPLKRERYYLGDAFPGIYFTWREAQCMLLTLSGYTIAACAEALQLSPRTVEYYLKNMRVKLQCANKRSLVAFVKKTDFMGQLNFTVTDILTMSDPQ